MRKSYDSRFKAKVALEALRGERTLPQLSSQFGVHVNQISKWKKQALEQLPDIFSRKREKQKEDSDELVSELYRQVGQLKVELDWLKKKSERLS